VLAWSVICTHKTQSCKPLLKSLFLPCSVGKNVNQNNSQIAKRKAHEGFFLNPISHCERSSKPDCWSEGAHSQKKRVLLTQLQIVCFCCARVITRGSINPSLAVTLLSNKKGQRRPNYCSPRSFLLCIYTAAALYFLVAHDGFSTLK
jgi:hypothetical protein